MTSNDSATLEPAPAATSTTITNQEEFETTVTAAARETGATQTAHEENEVAADTQPDGDDTATAPASTATAPAEDASLEEQAPLQDVAVPEPIDAIPVTGVFSALAALFTSGLLLLTISKSGNELLLTIQPPADKQEPKETVIPLQVKGTPDDLDANLAQALQSYVPTRQLAIESAAEVAKRTAAAANAARKTAKTTGPTSSASSYANQPKRSPVIVKLSPAEAKLTVTDSKGVEHAVTCGERVRLPIGTYTFTATLPEREPITQTHELKESNEVTRVKIEFPKDGVVTVKATPKDAKITLTHVESGRVIALENSTKTSLAPGHYALEVSKDGHEPYRQTLTIAANSQAVTALELPTSNPSLF